jgi:hypothetical protein
MSASVGGGLQVIELRPHAAADMDIPPTSMVNTRRIQVRLDVYSTGPLASFMMKHGLVAGVDGARFVSEQGTKMGGAAQHFARADSQRAGRG